MFNQQVEAEGISSQPVSLQYICKVVAFYLYLYIKKMPLYPVISMHYNLFFYKKCEVMLHVVRCFLATCWSFMTWWVWTEVVMSFVYSEQKKEGKCPTNALLVPEVRLRRAAGTTDRPAAAAFSQTKSPQNAVFTPVVSYANSLLNHLENAQ